MFGKRYFAARYFAPRYFPPAGLGGAATVPADSSWFRMPPIYIPPPSPTVSSEDDDNWLILFD